MVKKHFIVNATVFTMIFISQIWALSGKLIDNSNNPLADAEVFLANENLRITTDANGAFAFSSMALGKTGLQKYYVKPSLSGNRIYFSMYKSGVAEYVIFSLKGTVVSQFHHNFPQGNHILPIKAFGNSLAKGIYLVKFKNPCQTASFRYNYVDTKNSGNYSRFFEQKSIAENIGVNGYGAAADVPSVVDTLVIRKVIGDVTSMRKIMVYSYSDDINDNKYTSNGMQMVIIDPSNDNDADGLTNFEERYVYHTNAELADSDGDGVSDFAEINNHTNPRIADHPSVSFIAKSNPVVIATYSKSVEDQEGRDISSGGDYSVSSEFTAQQTVNASVSVAIMVGFEAGSSSGAFDGCVNGSVTGTVGAGWGMTWGSTNSEAMSRNWSSTESYARSKGVTIEGGRIKIEIELINNSNVNITLVNPMIRLSTTESGISTLGTEIGELALFTGDGLSGDNLVSIPFLPGSNKVTRLFGINISNPDIIEKVAQNSCGLKAQLTNVVFQTSLGAIDTLMANVYRRTAEVTVDYGTASIKKIIKKNVLSRSVYNEFYHDLTDRYISSTISDLINEVGAVTVVGTDSGTAGITAIDDVKNGDLPAGTWSIALQATPDSVQIYSNRLRDYDPRTIRVGNATIVSCVYDADKDGDGLPDRVEAALGTCDSCVDSDGDNISDRNEYAGWSRTTDPANTKWKTNPTLKDTDHDGINDYEDSDPLSAAINPLDSTVTISKLVLSSSQGTSWTAPAITDTLTNLTVNQMMRGPAKLTLVYSRPVYGTIVVCKGNNDTVKTTADSISCSLPLNLGTNSVEITVYSKNGTSKKIIVLGGIERRLARIDHSNAKQFTVSAPSADKLGIVANCYIGADSILALDPLISKIMLMRVAVDGLQENDAVKYRTQDLGDEGNGDAGIKVGSSILGKDSPSNLYSLRYLDKTPGFFSDTGLAHDSNYVYSLYSYATFGSKNYYTAPVNTNGITYVNERTIVVDSIEYFMSCSHNWGGTSNWHCQIKKYHQVDLDWEDEVTTDRWIYQDQDFTYSFSPNWELEPANAMSIVTDWRVDYGGAFPAYSNHSGWQTLQLRLINNDCLTYNQVVRKVSFTRSSTDNGITTSVDWSYGTLTTGSYTKPGWYYHWYDGSNTNHNIGFQVYWKYKYNDIRHDWQK